MKTTLDLPDDLLIEAKAIAARRRTTLKAMIEHSLRREISQTDANADNDLYEKNEHGTLVLKRHDKTAVITSEMIYQMMEDEGM